MKYPHFFKAICRLGLPNIPHRMNEQNIGVEDAPDYILTKDFLSQFPKAQVSEYRFPNPEDVKGKDYWQSLASNLEGCKLKILEDLKDGEIQIVVGGDNSVTFSSMLVVLGRFDANKVGYIQFDTHGEANSYKTSPTKNFHGMYLRPLVVKFDIEEIDKLVKKKIPSKNLFFIGIEDINPGDEEEFYQLEGLKIFNKDQVKKNGQLVQEELSIFIKKMDHIHINFDVDCIDESITPATGIPTEKGLLPENIWPLLEIIKSHPSWSLDLVEVNPKKQGAEKTIKFVQKLLKLMFSP